MEVDVNKVVPKKQIEVLNKVMNDLVGPFQVILIVKTHMNIMNQMVRDEVERLFKSKNRAKSFGMIRETKNALYLTFSDGKAAYEVYAEYNNYYIEKYDITLLIRVENEEIYPKLYERELWDCLEALYYTRHNSIADKEDSTDVE